MPWVKESTGEPVPDDLVSTTAPKSGAAFLPKSVSTKPPGEIGAPPGPLTRTPTIVLGGKPLDDETRYDIEHPEFAKYFRRPVTNFMASALSGNYMGQPTELSQGLAKAVVPQDWTQAALLPLMAVPGVGEMGEGSVLAEKAAAELPEWAGPVARAAGKGADWVGGRWYRRLALGPAVGAGTSVATGEPIGKETLTRAAEGGAITGLPEVLRGAAPIGRMILKPNYIDQVTNDAASTIGKHLPGVKPGPEGVGELTDSIADEATEVMQPTFNKVDNAMAGRKVKMVHVKLRGGVRTAEPVEMSLPKAARQFEKLRSVGYLKGGGESRTLTANKARSLLSEYREKVARQIDAQTSKGMGNLWLGGRDYLARAHSFERMFGDGVVDEESGKIDPEKWVKAAMNHRDDLVQHFGEDGYQDILRAGGYRRGMVPQSSERPHIGVRLHGPHAGLGRTLRPPRVLENWMHYPPRGFIGMAPGMQPLTRWLASQAYPELETEQLPPRVPTEVPEGTP